MLEDFSFGVMQGRLLPKHKGRYQAHPKGYWKSEFDLAAGLGVSYIEFIFDYEDAYENPLMCKSGISKIRDAVNATGVEVRSICADYFMEAPLSSYDESVAKRSFRTLESLIDNASLLNVSDIVIPCVDQSSIRGHNRERCRRLVQIMRAIATRAEEAGINLSLETDLPPKPFVKMLDDIDSHRVTVNYDTGNSAALGYDPVEEFAAYGDRITDIHIKDRVRGGGPVELGTGDTDFRKVF